VAVSVLGPFNLYILADVGRIVRVVYLRHVGIIAKKVSYGHLCAAALGLLPYQLVPVAISLPKITGIFRICIT
jgi:hypothetical protein